MRFGHLALILCALLIPTTAHAGLKAVLSGVAVMTPSQGGTGTSTTFTSGSIVFADTNGNYAQDNANLFFNSTSKFVGIGTNNPGARLDINSGGTNHAYVGAWATSSTFNALSLNGSLSSVVGLLGGGDTNLYVVSTGNINLRPGGATTNTDVVTPTGAIGIGTTAPATNMLLDVRGPIKSFGYTVATLPSGSVGAIAYVTDQNVACVAAGAALTGGGAVTCPVFYNGSAWVGM